jgi:hypothetical protein
VEKSPGVFGEQLISMNTTSRIEKRRDIITISTIS